MSLTIEQLERFATDLACAPECWRQHVRHQSDARVFEQIWDDPEVNAWVICWSEDQDTGFHDHDESSAAIAVISGEVREDRLRLGAPPRSRVLGAGSTFTVPSVAIHRVLHSGEAPAVTIHAYSPPLSRTGAYRTDGDGYLHREVLTLEQELRAEADLAAQAARHAETDLAAQAALNAGAALDAEAAREAEAPAEPGAIAA